MKFMISKKNALLQASLLLPRDTSGRARTGLALMGDWGSWRCVWWSVRVRVQRESGLLPFDLPPVVAAVEDFLEKSGVPKNAP